MYLMQPSTLDQGLSAAQSGWGKGFLSDVLVRFGQRLRELRLQKEISQEKLAELAGLRGKWPGGQPPCAEDDCHRNEHVRGELVVDIVHLDEDAKCLDVLPEQREVPPGRPDARPMVDRINDEPADRADNEADGNRY